MNRKTASRNPVWLSPEGEIDVAKFPIDGILTQAMSEERRVYHSGLGMLGSMYASGRSEAGVFLLGLLLTAGDNWERRIAIVEALRVVETQVCADLLFSELKRVKSSNTTRRYLSAILRVLSRMPSELVLDGLTDLVGDESFSQKMKSKFNAILEEHAFRKDYF